MEIETIKDFIDDIKFALTHTEFCSCKICRVIKKFEKENNLTFSTGGQDERNK